MHSVANMYGAFDVVLYFVIIQLFWLLINLLLILSYLIYNENKESRQIKTDEIRTREGVEHVSLKT